MDTASLSAKCGCKTPFNPSNGPTPRLGGADWQDPCGLFRAPQADFIPDAYDSDVPCTVVDGVPVGCDPVRPYGLVLVPFTEVLANGVSNRILTETRGARLLAFVVTRAVNNATGAAATLVTLGNGVIAPWTTDSINQAYPDHGRDSSWANPSLAVQRIEDYSAAALLDGRNPLPKWVPSIDLKNGNDSLITTFNNTEAAGATVTITGYMYIYFTPKSKED